jgi:hypothetical protein
MCFVVTTKFQEVWCVKNEREFAGLKPLFKVKKTELMEFRIQSL